MLFGSGESFLHDPWDPARALARRKPAEEADRDRADQDLADQDRAHQDLADHDRTDHDRTDQDRADVESDLADLEVYQVALEPRGVLGLAVECDGCATTHFLSWGLVRSNLEDFLDADRAGHVPVHEPACNPCPSRYVSWEYARGFVDGMICGSAWRDSGDDDEEPTATA